MNTQLIPLDNIFHKEWLFSRKELQYPLGENQRYRIEVNNWLKFFDEKGWLTENLVQRLRTARSWGSYYAKVNELRAGYFFERKLHFALAEYESPTIESKNVEFKGSVNGIDVFIEVKTLIDLDRKEYKGGFYNNDDKIYDLLDKASLQLPDDNPAIVVLSDDINVPLLDDPLTCNSIWTSFNSSDYERISAVCVLGNIYHEQIYEMEWAVSPNAKNSISENIFNGFDKLHQFL